MKPNLLKCAFGVAVLLPLPGVAGIAIQGVIGPAQAGADTTGMACFESGSTITISVESADVTVDLDSGIDGLGDPAGCLQYDEDTGFSTSDFSIDSANIYPSGFVSTVDIPIGDIATDDSTVLIFTEGDSPTTATLGSNFPGCTLTRLLTPHDMELSGSGGVLSGGPITETGITVGGSSCSEANVNYLNGQIASGVNISGSVTMGN